MKTRWIVSILCSILSSALLAQNDMRGFIITMDLDTIEGQIKDDFRHRLSERVKFKTKSTAKFEYYKPNAIKEFHYNENELYKSFPIQIEESSTAKKRIEKRFLRCLVSGKLNLYLFEESNKKRFFIENGANQLLELPKTKTRIEVGLRTFVEEDLSAVRRLKNVFYDCKQAYYLIDKGLLIKRGNLIKLVATYNKCHETEIPQKILFQKEPKQVTINLIGNYPINGEGAIGYGAMAELMIPSWSKMVSLSAGYSIFPDNVGDYSFKPLSEITFRLNMYLNYNRKINPYAFVGGARLEVADQIEYRIIDQNGFFAIELRDGRAVGGSTYYGIGSNFFITPHHQLKLEIAHNRFTHVRLGYGYRF